MNIKGDIAIIGMSGRFPGADDVSGFWDNLRAGRDSIRTLSDQELRAAGVSEAELADPDYVKAAATLNGVDRFDPAFFRISPREAELIDPQIRLLLQCAWETLEDAGRAGKGPQNIGVFAGAGGVATSYFAQYINLHERFDKLTAGATHLGNDKDFLSTYLSYKLNLTGPSMTVQTACSTSLVALHQARLSLLSGECDMALAGGVSVRVPHGHGYQYKDGYIFSRGGRVRSFDADADGVVFGSGLGLVLIKRLEDALRDGDAIHALVKGSAIGNDGKGKMSYAASSAKGQIACIRAALANAGVDAASIGLVETHGTGTAMGDPEEVKALAAAFKEHTDAKGYCALGAVKANVGHLEAAAGVVGLIKAALAVKHGAIVPMAHYRAPNPRIKFDNSPFYIDPAGREWRQGKGPRRAAVNSLGVGGTNAFAILEQHVPARRARGKGRAQAAIVPLSARTDESLRAYALKLADFLDGAGSGLELGDVAFTLQEGREAMECRAAFAASSLTELSAALRAFGAGAEPPQAQGAAASWCAREELDWSAHRTGPAPRRVHLPTYVFARERCWIDPAPAATPAAAQLHPLLHTNTSDLREHRYSTALRGDEFFLRDHRLRTAPGATDARKVLPGVAYLEMARAAMQRALPAPAEGGGWRLRDLVWVQPVVVDAPRAIDIALLADEDDGDTLAFEVFSDEDTVHCQGRGRWEAQPLPAPLDLAAIGAGLSEGWQADALYPAFAAMGLDYGPAHRPIVSTRQDRDRLLATMRLPSAAQAGADAYVLHPSLLDGALQAATALIADLREPPAQPLVPFALDELRVWAACETDMVAWVRRAPGAQRLAKFDIDLCDAQGRVCAQLRGFVARAMGKDSTAALLATQVWETAPVATGAAPAGDRRAVLFGFPGIDPQALPGRASAQPLPQGDAAGRYAQLAATCFETLREVLRERPSAPVLVQFVLPAHAENDVFAGCSGLLKTASLENPLLRAQLLFVAPDIDAAGLSRLLDAEGDAPGDVLVRHSGGERSAARWRLLDDDSADAADTGGAFKDDGVYLITGGLGGLGALFAREILSATTRATVLLSGRASADEIATAPEKQALLASLRAAGGRVEYRQIDLSDAAKVQEAIDAIVREHGRLNGILHSAGMVADEFILKKSPETFAAVLAPKVAGSAHLDAATRELDLDFIALFSSLGSALGNLGQADYAAANGFLDEFAAQRNALAAAGQRRGRSVAIRWPLWREGGMQLSGDDLERLHEATGIRPMRTRTGLAMFYRSLAGQHDQTVVMEGDPARMRIALGLERAAAAPAPAAATAANPVATGDLRERTEDYLRRQLSALLKLPAGKVDPAAPLEDYGIDSILALDLTKALERSFGPLAKTLFFEYLSLRELAGYFVAAHAPRLHELFADTGAAVAAPAPSQAAAAIDDGGTGRRRLRAAAARRAEPARSFAGEPIAIVGLSGRYPQARDIDAYWEVLREGRDCIVEIPPERWDWREYYSEDRSQPGRHYSKWGGFIEGVDEFDARFFNISPREADTIDPQERLFLQQAWMAIEDAGYTRQSLQTPGPGGLPAPVGVYAGVMYGEYQLLGAEASLLGQPMGFASNPASIANRVSYALNLHGPSMVVDTMCSSSLTAIHVACQDLKLGRTSLAIAGGVNVTIHPNKYLMLSAGQFISGDGHCQSFGEGGDGYIPGEGVGAVVLKRLSDAQRDGDRIYGVIRGSALSHGGKTNGYTVPNPQAQAGAIRQALIDAGVDARQVSYLEAHGTGTKLGDPIEIAALTKVFREHTDASGYCLIGSAKSNIGHCEAAAGIAGLTKVLLQLKHRAIVPSLHSARLNPHIDFDATPFVVNQRLRAWDAPRVDGRELPRIAGISSFGAGGSNAHLLIEEYVPAAAVEPADEAWIVPLSARTAEQLHEKARDLLAWLRADAGAASLASIAQTLQVGREAMNERLGVLAASTEALSAALQAFVEGREQADVRRGQARSASPAPSAADMEAWTAARDLASLLAAWVDGQALDWARLYPQAQPRLSLPAYPFARQRHWIDVRAGARGAAKRAAALHPLLHRNGSDLLQHSYTADFAGDEWFLDGEPGARSLSAAACLEMARAAFAAALPEQGEPGVLELREIAWARPGVAAAGQTLAISLFDRRGDALRFEIHAAGADAAVHCQGLVERVRAAIAPRVDVQTIRRDAPATLIRLQLAAEQGDERGAYGLHPALAQAALSAAGAGLAPVAVAVARIASGVGQPVWAWVRPAVGGGFDIDLCDESGAVSAQLHGVRFALAAAPVRSAPATHSDPAAAATQAALPPAIAAGPRRVAYAMARSAAGGPAAFAPAALKKPDSVALVAQAAELPARSAAQAKPTVALAPRTDADVPTAVAPGAESADDVQVFDHGNGVFAIRIESNEGTETLTPQRIERLLAALRAVEALPAARALVLCGTSERFLAGGRDAHNAATAQGLYGAIAGFAYPVIAAVRGAARGAGFLAAALCDFMLVGETAQCGFTDADGGLLPAAAESFLRQRFGTARADDLLYLDRVASGADLRAKGWRCPVAPCDEIEARAFALAAELAAKPQESLRLLKRHLARELIDAAAGIAGSPPAVAVAAPAMPQFALASPHLALRAAAPGVAIATLRAGDNGFDPDATLAALHDLAAELAASAQCRSLVLTSEHPGFLPLAADQGDLALAWRQAVSALPCAVTTVLDGDASALGWFAAWCGEVCVHRADARYSALGLSGAGALAEAAANALSRHLDADEAAQVLLGIDCGGDELRSRFGALRVAEAGRELDSALRAAEALAALPAETLVEWKRVAAASADAPSEADEFPAAATALVPGPVALDSAVVSATAHADGVLELRLADRDARNLFSDAFSHGLRAAFAHVEASGAYKAVVVTGYDNYFSTGGTRDTLLAIHQGRAKFTDNLLFRLPLDCAVPVVAAIQGHAIGAGWALGMFADVAILAEESHYASPYMGYGFTPGAGATLAFPHAVGHDLARETLLSAREYTGADLAARGLRQQVLPRERVFAAALTTAQAIARNPRERLLALKRRRMRALQPRLEETLARELAMHEITFVGQAETLARIEGRFGAESAGAASASAAVAVAARIDLPAVSARLRQMLSHELRLAEHEIGADELFVDLGLDSITGVTWVRRINEAYGTAIEAIKVYSYPTLAKLAQHVLDEAGAHAPVADAAFAATAAAAAAPAAAATAAPALDGVVARLRATLAHELRLGENEIGADELFVDLGLDSITGVTWVRRINEAYGTAIEAIKVYSYPTLGQLARYVAEEAAQVAASAPAAPAAELAVPAIATAAADDSVVVLRSWRSRASTPSAGRGQSADPRIAVIGMTGRFAGADDLQAFWRNLAEGRDSVGEIPADRWDVDAYFQAGDIAPGKSYSKWMGALDGYDRFDAAFFNISPREARSMDPQQRLFLQACWHGIEHAGYDPRALAGSRCGVFAGCAANDYHQLSQRERLSGQGFTGAAPSILAARISYFLDLHGPSLSIDTACSSSLVAIANACDSLSSGACDLALAGGVNVMAGPSMHIMTAQVGMLSPRGRCFAFDERADGIAPGEGVGVVVLKRLADAERDGDCIYGVVEGWGANQDGKTNGITAPNADSQARLQREVYRRFGIDPAGIGLIEAHGTGTALGDPIEVAGLKASFADFTQRRDYCALGSVKSNIGHCLAAAGVSGFIKALLALRHAQLPPAAQFERLNPHIALQGSPFYVNQRLRDWPSEGGAPRRAAINSFGFSGTNAHAVVAEYVEAAAAAAAAGEVLLPLSARTAAQLQQRVRDLLAFVAADPAVDLRRVAHTLQTGREAMSERLAVVAGSVAELRERLHAWLDRSDSGAAIAGVWRGDALADKSTLTALAAEADFQAMIDKWFAQQALPRLADLWAKGLALDWRRLYPAGGAPRRIGLPVYPFARERFWIDAEADGAEAAPVASAELHPLLHVNISDLRRQAYRTVVRGNERRLAGAQATRLPEQTYLDMARAAVADALPELRGDGGAALRLSAIEWSLPDGFADLVTTVAPLRGGAVAFEIAEDGDDGRVHCRGVADAGAEMAMPIADPATPEPIGAAQPPAATAAPASSALPLERLQRELRESLAEALLMQASDVNLDKSFTELGLDSILGVEWVKQINRSYGTELAATRVYDYPSVRALAAYLHTQVRGDETTVAAAPVAAAPFAAAQAPAPSGSVSREAVQAELRASLAEALLMQVSDVNIDKSFTELGLDSILGVEWVKQINRSFGTELAATRVYDYPSVRALAAYLHPQVRGDEAEVAAPQAAAVAAAPAAPTAAARVSVSREAIQAELRASLAEALLMQVSDVNLDKSFTELGLDSILGVEWVKQINRRYGTELAATRVYDYPSVRALAAYLHPQVHADAEAVAPAVVAAPVLVPAQPAPMPAPRAAAARATSSHRFAPRGGFAFAPKYDARSRQLYFYSPHAEGDFDADGEFAVVYRLSPDDNVCLREHVVFGEHLLPTDAYIDLVLSACRSYFDAPSPSLRQIAIANPLLGRPGEQRPVRVVFRRSGEELQFFVKSRSGADGDDETLHMQGFLTAAAAPAAPRFDTVDADAGLERAQIPTNAGRYYAPLERLQFGASAAVGTVRPRAHEFAFAADPFALYGGLCTVINYAAHLAARHYGASDDQFLPHRIGRIDLVGELGGRDYRCLAELTAMQPDAFEFRFSLVDGDGHTALTVEDIVLRRVAAAGLRRNAQAAPRAISVVKPRATGGEGDQVAIIGMSCRYPMSENLDAFWDNLLHGRDCVGEVPPGRWFGDADWFHSDPRHPHTSYSKWAGLLDRIDAFDPLFFGISPAEAELIDPQQRIFLEECWKAIEHAGYAPGALSGEACGVYVGCAAGDYARVLNGAGQDTAGAAFMGTSSAILAARIAYYLNLKGPALAIDTACSSSLVAVHLACDSIRNGENRMALVGGINLLTTPIGHILTSQVGMPSRDGRCAAFDASANGIVFSEGCGVLLLKSLAQAQRDGDDILGVIEGSGINQDGKTNGITAPSSNAQERLLRQVYDRFGIDPRRIGYVEAHGTATALGDPIEVNALSAVFGAAGAQNRACVLGSVKSNIGHTGFAAGVAGMIKALLCLRQRTLVPSIHYATPNPHIDFVASPFYVGTERRDWDSAQPRVATVSSFGFSGTNAHVVVAEYPAAAAAAPSAPPPRIAVPLSARAAPQLRQRAVDLLAFVRAAGPELDLARLAGTLQLGRDAMEHRAGFVAVSAEDLAAKLQDYLDGERRSDGVYRGPAVRDEDALAMFAGDDDMGAVIAQWFARGNLGKLMDLWVRGLDLDWSALYPGSRPKPMALPTYPFARERCWPDAVAPARTAAAAASLHPLLHRNASDLEQQRYLSRFDGSEFFLADHRVQGVPVLPAVAYLEMARAAILDAVPGAADPSQLHLRHIAWQQPIAVAGEREVELALSADDSGKIQFEVLSADGEGERLHCLGHAAWEPAAPPAALDLAELRRRMTRGRLDAAALYPRFAAMGLGYGPALQGILAVEHGDGEALLELRLPDAAGDHGAYVLHPSAMDSALQGSIGLIADAVGHDAPALPFALESLRVLAPCAPRMQAWVRYAPGGVSPQLVKVDIDLCGDDGRVCVQMRGFSSRPIDAGGRAAAAPVAAVPDENENRYLSIIQRVLDRELSIDEAVELG